LQQFANTNNLSEHTNSEATWNNECQQVSRRTSS